jgi:transcriptional regulator with XRE-family HTH domain
MSYMRSNSFARSAQPISSGNLDAAEAESGSGIFRICYSLSAMATDSGVDLGERLRALRTRNHWRISDVTRMTGVAASTISKVENGRMSLTYDKLQQLATGLSLDLADLFTDRKQSETPELGAARRSLGRAGQGVVVEASSYEYRFLNADLAPKQMVPIIGEAKARTLEEFGELVKHDGEEFLLVLEGAMTVHCEFYAPVVLHVGDHLYIDSRMGHAYLAAADGKCRALVICSGAPSDELERAVLRHPGGTARKPGSRKGLDGKGKSAAGDVVQMGKGAERQARPTKTRK